MTGMSVGSDMTDASIDNRFNYSGGILSAPLFNGDLSGNVSGNASSSTTSANLSVGDANRVVFKDASNNAATSANLAFDGTILTSSRFVSPNSFKAGTTRLANGMGNSVKLSADGGIELERSDELGELGGPYIDFKYNENAGNGVDMEARIQYDTGSVNACLLYTSPSPRD